jgi:hypothetical protein
MDEKILASYTGNMQQLASIRPFIYNGGRPTGMRAYEITCGPLRFTAMADKCLDIADCNYKGVNLNFLAKPGLMGRSHFDTNGREAQRSIMGGLFFTSGLENICAPCIDNGVAYPMHGRLRTTPAEHLCADAAWEEGKYRITLCGEMREAELFGENLTLRRKITTVLGENRIVLRDEFKNCGHEAQPFMLLYHFNFGYPFLKEDARLLIPAIKTESRDSAGNLSRWHIMDPPIPGVAEQVFMHELRADHEGNTFAAIIDEDRNLGIKLDFNKSVLPRFMEWKSTAAGDYVLGLEPANSSVFGRLEQKKQGLPMLQPFETSLIEIKMEILDGPEVIKILKDHPLLHT